MKLSALTLLLAVFCLASCDNDEKENELIIDPVEDIISGTYQGYSTCRCPYSRTTADGKRNRNDNRSRGPQIRCIVHVSNHGLYA